MSKSKITDNFNQKMLNLAKQQSGELAAEIPFILSNHLDLEIIANRFEIPFYHVPVSKETKANAENIQLDLLKKHKVDFLCYKYISDSADSNASDDWAKNVAKGCKLFREEILDNLSQPLLA